MKTVTITTALITAALASSPVLAKNSSVKFDVNAAASSYDFQQTLLQLKDSTHSQNSFTRKATLTEKQRLSEVMLKANFITADHAAAQPRILLIGKP